MLNRLFAVLGTYAVPKPRCQRLCLWTPSPAGAGLVADAQLSAMAERKVREKIAALGERQKHSRIIECTPPGRLIETHEALLNLLFNRFLIQQ